MPVPQWTITDFTYREPWWKNRGTSFVKRIQINNVLDYPAILILNICLILPLLSSTLNGFDSSMMNSKSHNISYHDRGLVDLRSFRFANLARMARVLQSTARHEVRYAAARFTVTVLFTVVRTHQLRT